MNLARSSALLKRSASLSASFKAMRYHSPLLGLYRFLVRFEGLPAPFLSHGSKGWN